MDEGTISGKIGKEVFLLMYETGQDPEAIIERKGLKQVSDQGVLEKAVDDAIKANPKEVEKYKAGKVQLMGFFVGQVMKATKGQANPKMVNELIRKKLQ